MPRERELGRWCKTSPQILFDPKNRAAPSFSLVLGSDTRTGERAITHCGTNYTLRHARRPIAHKYMSLIPALLLIRSTEACATPAPPGMGLKMQHRVALTASSHDRTHYDVTDAIADVNRRAEPGGDLQSFADVHKVFADPPTTGEYRYGEEYEGDMPKDGEHSVTAADKQVEKASQADLVNLSSTVAALPGAESLAEHEAGLIMAKIT